MFWQYLFVLCLLITNVSVVPPAHSHRPALPHLLRWIIDHRPWRMQIRWCTSAHCSPSKFHSTYVTNLGHGEVPEGVITGKTIKLCNWIMTNERRWLLESWEWKLLVYWCLLTDHICACFQRKTLMKILMCSEFENIVPVGCCISYGCQTVSGLFQLLRKSLKIAFWPHVRPLVEQVLSPSWWRWISKGKQCKQVGVSHAYSSGTGNDTIIKLATHCWKSSDQDNCTMSLIACWTHLSIWCFKHFSVLGVSNTWNLKVNSFETYFTHTMECV
jgi:hypothetical protein